MVENNPVTKHVEPLAPNELPFSYLFNEQAEAGWVDYIQRDTPRGQRVNEARKNVRILGLNGNSTADDVRKCADRLKLETENKGITNEMISSLRWALKKTHDCEDDTEFLDFLTGLKTFSQIESYRIVPPNE